MLNWTGDENELRGRIRQLEKLSPAEVRGCHALSMKGATAQEIGEAPQALSNGRCRPSRRAGIHPIG